MLRLLSRRPMYGYELVQAIKAPTSEQLEFGEGSVYPVLHRLEAEGCLRSREETVNGRSRFVYRVTKKGEKRLATSSAAWERIAAAINAVLNGDDNGRQTA